MRTLSLLSALVLFGCRVEGDTKTLADHDQDGVNAGDDCDDEDAAVGEADPYWLDVDRDGHGDPATETYACARNEGYVEVGDDCDDANAAIFPGAADVCDKLDNDCDGTVDNGLESSQYYTDIDHDGYGDDATVIWDCTQPADTVTVGGDCNDADAAYHPDAPEEDCEDPNDYNCDGSVGFTDADADGFAACAECDDGNAAVNPGAAEICNGDDDDCDGLTDDADDSLDASAGAVVYADLDGDGFGDPASPEQVCDPGPGWVADATDCNDADMAIHPGADEVCDGLDNDCDTLVDDADDSLDLSTAATWYTDADADGYGDDGSVVVACAEPLGASAVAGDCNDADAAYNPGVIEADCTDPNDYNCDGSVGYSDADGDGWAACAECDDTSAANFPGATELCDGVDNNCDGTVDEDTAADAATWYADADGDTYGNAASTTLACSAPAGYVTDTSDCDDSNAGVHPGATETCDSVDEDCDGTVDNGAVDMSTWHTDADRDGYGDPATGTLSCTRVSGTVFNDDDCDDTASAVNPAATEYCDGIDNNCDGVIDEDAAADVATWYADTDGDTYGNATSTAPDCDQPAGYVADATDCNDTAGTIHPGATELCDGIDQDCDGVVDDGAAGTTDYYADVDGDTYGDPSASMTSCGVPAGYVTDNNDCNDANPAINPAATETCDLIDNDCDGTVDDGVGTTYYRDADLDGYGTAATTTSACELPAGYSTNDNDCDDSDATAYPGAIEINDGVDNDCDGTIDEAWWVGDGHDGSLSVPAGSTLTLAAGWPVTTISGTNITVDGTPTVVAGDEVLVINSHGSDGRHANVGAYEFYTVDSVSGSVVTVVSSPSVTFGETSNASLAGQDIQMVPVPNYTTVTVGAGATLTTEGWDGSVGGVLAFRATGTVTLGSSAMITVDELGFAGGTTGTAYNNDAFQGESYAGSGDGNLDSHTGVYANWTYGYYLANYGGGGAMITGGGGNYGGGATAGASWNGGGYPEAAAGDEYGDVALDSMYFGSGGAGVWHGSSSPGSGGDGAGLIFLGVETLTVTSTGSLSALGGSTSAWATGTWTYGAGGGAGGTIWVIADAATIPADAIYAFGGDGESTHTRDGGNGGDGRIRLDFNTLNGYTSGTAAATRQAENACDPDAGTVGTP